VVFCAEHPRLWVRKWEWGVWVWERVLDEGGGVLLTEHSSCFLDGIKGSFDQVEGSFDGIKGSFDADRTNSEKWLS